MKKTIQHFFEYKWAFLFSILLTSCSVQNQINKDDFNTIPKNFTAAFYDQPDTIVNQYDSSIRVRSLVKDFAAVNTINYSKPIQIALKKNVLYLKFEDNNQKQYVLQFSGEKRKKKFVFYTNYETVSFPVLFISKEMTKYTIYLSKNDELIFENHSVSEGMLLFFGGYNSSAFDYKFKLLRNE